MRALEKCSARGRKKIYFDSRKVHSWNCVLYQYYVSTHRIMHILACCNEYCSSRKRIYRRPSHARARRVFCLFRVIQEHYFSPCWPMFLTISRTRNATAIVIEKQGFTYGNTMPQMFSSWKSGKIQTSTIAAIAQSERYIVIRVTQKAYYFLYAWRLHIYRTKCIWDVGFANAFRSY